MSQLEVCKDQIYLSTRSTCKVIEVSLATHSPNRSSSQANNLRRHLQASPFAPHPFANILATVSNLFSDNSNNHTKPLYNGFPSSQGSTKNKVDTPSPTWRVILSSNHHVATLIYATNKTGGTFSTFLRKIPSEFWWYISHVIVETLNQSVFDLH